jgi:hypothetical protein
MRAKQLADETLYTYLRDNYALMEIVKGNPDGYTADDVVNLNGLPDKMLVNILEGKNRF